MGTRVGLGTGCSVGRGVGSSVGCGVGSGTGPRVGFGVGSGVGSRVGIGVGSPVGSGVGALEGVPMHVKESSKMPSFSPASLSITALHQSTEGKQKEGRKKKIDYNDFKQGKGDMIMKKDN